MPLGVKLAGGTLVVLVVVSALLALQLARQERLSLLASKRVAAEMVADLFAAALVAPLDFGDSDAIEIEAGRVRQSRDVVQVVVWGAEGPVSAGGAQDTERPRAESAAAFSGEFLDVTRPVRTTGGKALGALRVRYSLARENAAYEEGKTRIVWLSGGVALATAAALIWLARRQIVAPLSALVEAAQGMERGETTAAVKLEANDEIGRLGAAFNRMATAIADRERRLAETSRELQLVLDHTGQGILVFSADGSVQGGRSREATRLFGEGLEGHDVHALLFPEARPSDVEARALREWLLHAPHVADADWEEFARLAPREVTLEARGQGRRTLALEFRRIPAPGGGPRTMLLVTDVTAQRALEQTVAKQQAEHERQLSAMRRLAAGGGHLFASFLASAKARVARGREALQGEPSAAEHQAIFQGFHTMKGEARSLGLDALGGAIHEVESALVATAEARQGGGPEPGRGRLSAALDEVREQLERAERFFIEASPIGAAALEQIPVQRGDVEELERLAGRLGGDVARLAARLSSRPFGECVVLLLDSAPAWAEAAGKRARVDVQGRDARVPGPLARVLPGMLAHLVRNALVHSIEAPSRREAKGKPPGGLVSLRCEPGPDGVVVSVEDDGAGIDEPAILARARERGLDVPPGGATELLFSPGFSTASAVSDLAGRGVGLSAVRDDARALGYELSLVSPSPVRFVLRPRP